MSRERIQQEASIPDRPEVLIAGAGPVGLTLALTLARAGRRVLVLEKEASTAEHSRAPAIWPRTQEILSELGVLESFLARGLTLDRVDLRDADAGTGPDPDFDPDPDPVILSLPVEELAGETQFPHLLILPQSETERLLHEAVRAERTARVVFGAEVREVREVRGVRHARAAREFEAEGSGGPGVRVRYRREGGDHEVDADFVVGCDGAGSVVRESMGASFDGKTYDTRAALADLRPGAEPDLPFPRLSTRSGLAIAVRIDTGLWRLILPFGAGDERSLHAHVERAAIRLFPGVHSDDDYELVWQSEFRLHRRMAAPFVRGRVALAGDAAHLNSPIGGQGMNAGIQDVPALATALLRAVERDDPGALRAYERERRPALDRGVNVFTDRLTRILLIGHGRAIRPILAVVRTLLRVGPLRRRFLRRIAMLDR